MLPPSSLLRFFLFLSDIQWSSRLLTLADVNFALLISALLTACGTFYNMCLLHPKCLWKNCNVGSYKNDMNDKVKGRKLYLHFIPITVIVDQKLLVFVTSTVLLGYIFTFSLPLMELVWTALLLQCFEFKFWMKLYHLSHHHHHHHHYYYYYHYYY